MPEKTLEDRLKSRRTVLGGIAGAIALGAGALFLPRMWKDDPYAFLESQPETLPDDWRTIESRTVPLGPEKKLLDPYKTEVYARRQGEIKAHLSRFPEHTKGKWVAGITHQAYGRPEEPALSRALLAYAQKAEHFLYDNLGITTPLGVRWTPLENGQDWTKDWEHRGYICKDVLNVIRIRIRNDHRPEQHLTFGQYNHLSGICVRDPDGQTNHHAWFVAMCSGSSGLFSPFSELIPVLTRTQRYEHALATDERNASMTGEALDESISQFLARKLAAREGIADFDRRILDFTPLQGKELYKYVPNAIRFLESHGVRAAFELYKKSPQQFFEAIR